MEISIGIMAHNEGKNIGNLLRSLLKQKFKIIHIKEVIVVSSGSTDRTNEVVNKFKNKNVRLITQKKRFGKASAINEYMRASKSDILVLCSADIIPKDDAIEKLCLPLQNKKIGIVASHPIPKKNNSIIGKIVDLQWQLHHKISQKKPKFGELIAFRNVFNKIDNTAVDEEYIAMLIKKKGFKNAYATDAIVYNKGPDNISDFLKQRRRIYCGHMELKRKKRYKAATLDNLYVLNEYLKILKLKEITTALFAVILEAIGRGLGYYDYLTLKKHHIWDIARSTKK